MPAVARNALATAFKRVRRPVPARLRRRRRGPGQGFLLEREVGVDVRLRRPRALVPHPESDGDGIDPCMQEGHGRGVPQGMRSDVFVPDGRVACLCGCGMLSDQVLDGVGGQPPARNGREQRVAGVAGLLAEPAADYGGDVRGERGDAVLAALSVAAHGRPGSGPDIAAGLGGEGQQGVVAAAVPRSGVRGSEQGLDLAGGEVGDGRAGVLLRGDREDPGDRRGVLGVAQGGEFEERPERRQPGVAVPGGVAAVLLKVRKEDANQRGIEGCNVKAGGSGACLLAGVAEEQPPGVAVGPDGAGAGLPVAGHVLGEERFQGRREERHDAASAFSSRCAASASSSGTECKYQYVETGLTCPRYADRSGILAATSPPSRYQPASVRTAKVCLMSWILGGFTAFAPVPVTAVIRRNSASAWCPRSLVPYAEMNSAGAAGAGRSAAPGNPAARR